MRNVSIGRNHFRKMRDMKSRATCFRISPPPLIRRFPSTDSASCSPESARARPLADLGDPAGGRSATPDHDQATKTASVLSICPTIASFMRARLQGAS